MALWKDAVKGESLAGLSETTSDGTPFAETAPPKGHAVEQRRVSTNESLIGAGLTVEGKIEGEGNVRIAGHFKGDVQVKGNLTIETGARITGEIKADTVTVGGHVDGNINASSQVNLLNSAQLIGDLRVPALTVAAGSKMRGRVEFGWDEQEVKKTESKKAVEKPETRPNL